MRQRYVNKVVSKAVREFRIREKTPAAPEIEYHETSDGTKWRSMKEDLFASIDEDKIILGYVTEKGFDPWKRGTVEAKKVAELLSSAKWSEVQTATPRGIGFGD